MLKFDRESFCHLGQSEEGDEFIKSMCAPQGVKMVVVNVHNDEAGQEVLNYLTSSNITSKNELDHGNHLYSFNKDGLVFIIGVDSTRDAICFPEQDTALIETHVINQ